MSNEPKLGKTLDEFTKDRDAIHIAITPVIAMEELSPGEPIGIVDPFLKEKVQIGDRFYLFLYPQTITSLRHNWTHPAFTDVAKPSADTKASEKWLRGFLRNNGPDYEDLIEAVNGNGTSYSPDSEYGVRIDGDCVTVIGSDAHGNIPDEFWDHVEVVTGKKVKSRPAYFSCSC
jgi:hypothetical protein